MKLNILSIKRNLLNELIVLKGIRRLEIESMIGKYQEISINICVKNQLKRNKGNFQKQNNKMNNHTKIIYGLKSNKDYKPRTITKKSHSRLKHLRLKGYILNIKVFQRLNKKQITDSRNNLKELMLSIES
jgi:hypothetical protein